MDPLEYFPIEVAESIMQYLKPNELLLASEVSTLWYETIGSSMKLMKKITIRGPGFEDEVDITRVGVTDIFTSPRKYQNIDFSCRAYTVHQVCSILTVPGRKWRKVYLTNKHFKSDDFITLINAVQSSVEELKLWWISTDISDIDVEHLTFPKLQVLGVTYGDVLQSRVFQKCCTIKELSLKMEYLEEEYIGVIKQIADNNYLERLEISPEVFRKVFQSKYCFDFERMKLKSFEIDDGIDIFSQFPNDPIKMFLKLLESQMNTLQDITVSTWMGLDVVKLMFRLPKLSTLKLGWMNSREVTAEWINSQLCVNKNMRSFGFNDRSESLIIMQEFLKKTPNMTHLELLSIDQGMMEHLSNTFPNLTSLSVGLIGKDVDLTPATLFSNLECGRVHIYSDRFEEGALKIPEENRNRFVKLALSSCYHDEYFYLD